MSTEATSAAPATGPVPMPDVELAHTPTSPAVASSVPAANDKDNDSRQDDNGNNNDGHAAGRVEGAKPTFLHSPPDSNNTAKSEGSDSELSDLDEDAIDPPKDKDQPQQPQSDDQNEEPPKEDIGDIFPDHWSGTVPVFRPTMHQFKDFKAFMEKIDHYGMRSGIVKVIPPQEWKDAQPKRDELVKRVRVRDPIKQEIMGQGGTYRQVNVVHGRSYNVPQWRKLCDQSEHQPPARRGERRATVEKPKPAARARAAASTSSSAPKPKAAAGKKRGGARGRGRGRRKAKQEDQDEEAAEEDRPMTPVSPKAAEESSIKKEDNVTESIEKDPGVDAGEEEEQRSKVGRMGRMGGAKPAKGKAQTVSARRKNARREGSAVVDEEAFKDFDYEMDISDYTPERCEELERVYWKTLTYAPPLYGADMMGTLFDESTESWNLNKLPNLLDVLGTKVPGVNTAYLYLGMWKATFAWHLEDVDLYSINYLHFGAPKQWYSISQADARRFEHAMKQTWPSDAKACDQFLRHKGFLLSPQHLKQHYNITVNKCVSYPGEFVVTYPYGYHSGYNLGYNCAEAVNFALDSWLPMGKIAKRCTCAQAQDSVWIDVYDIERRLRGEETEYEDTEDEEEEDEDEDMEDASGVPSPAGRRTVKIAVPSRKRKRDPKDKCGRTKVKKVRLRAKTRVEPPCCLCPNDFSGIDLLPTDDGRKAHRMCALYLPETYIDKVDGQEVVANISGISKDRLDLKCLLCRSKRGGCFQCSQKKCARAYHATCAAAAGVFIEEAEVPVFGEDGTEYKEQAFEFSCRFHRTKRDKKLDGDALEEDPRILEAARGLKKGDICQAQFFKGDIFAGVVVENHKDEEMLLLDVIPNGDRVEVQWKWLLVPDPADYHLPKASANAIPMPSSQKAKNELNAKRAVDDTPRKDDTFVEGGFTWAEFHTCDRIANQEQVKADLEQDNKVWYYLGKGSTDAKALYTESPALPRHNPRSNYLDTLPKPAPRVKKPAPSKASPAHAQRRTSDVAQFSSPLSNSTTAGPASGIAGGIKPDKPYVYKPRKPIEPNWNPNSQPFTPQQFMPRQFPSPSQNSQQFTFLVQSRPGVYPGQAGQNIQGGQHAQPGQASQHGQFSQTGSHSYGQAHTFSQQRFAPPSNSNSPAPSPYASSPPATSPTTPQAPQKPWYMTNSGQTQAPHQRFSQHANQTQQSTPKPNNANASPYTSTSPATQGPWPSQQPATDAGTTASRGTPVHYQPQPGTPVAANQQAIHHKFPFFTVNHNRAHDQYRTPYSPGGGFINGFEGNFKAHMRNAPFSVLSKYAQLNAGNGYSPSNPTSEMPASMGLNQVGGGKPATTAHTQAGPTKNNWESAVFNGQFQPQPGSGGAGNNASAPSHGHAHAVTQPYNVATANVASATGSDGRSGASVPHQSSTSTMGPASTTTATSSMPEQGGVKIEKQQSTEPPPKPSAPKVQYKIPEKQTPVPLPPMYLASKKKTMASPHSPSNGVRGPTKTETESNKTNIRNSNSSSTPSAQNTPVSASPSNTPAQNAAVPKTETPVPIPRPRAVSAAQGTPSQSRGPRSGASTPLSSSPKAPADPSLSSAQAQPSPSGRTAPSTTSQVPAVPASSAASPQSRAAPAVETPVPLPSIPGMQGRNSSSRTTPSATPKTPHAATVGFPDVPQDSMALVEQMMVNLRRASSQASYAS